MTIDAEPEIIGIPARGSTSLGEASRSTGEVDATDVAGLEEPPTPSNVGDLIDEEETRQILEAEPELVYDEPPATSVKYSIIAGPAGAISHFGEHSAPLANSLHCEAPRSTVGGVGHLRKSAVRLRTGCCPSRQSIPWRTPRR